MNLLLALIRFLFGIWPHQQTQFQPIPTASFRRSRMGDCDWIVRFVWLPLIGWFMLSVWRPHSGGRYRLVIERFPASATVDGRGKLAPDKDSRTLARRNSRLAQLDNK